MKRVFSIWGLPFPFTCMNCWKPTSHVTGAGYCKKCQEKRDRGEI